MSAAELVAPAARMSSPGNNVVRVDWTLPLNPPFDIEYTRVNIRSTDGSFFFTNDSRGDYIELIVADVALTYEANVQTVTTCGSVSSPLLADGGPIEIRPVPTGTYIFTYKY